MHCLRAAPLSALQAVFAVLNAPLKDCVQVAFWELHRLRHALSAAAAGVEPSIRTKTAVMPTAAAIPDRRGVDAMIQSSP
jgi:hypothetical protein